MPFHTEEPCRGRKRDDDRRGIGTLKIDDFAVEDGFILLRFTAKPATWLYGFSDLIRIRASETLPIPAGDSSLLDLSRAELTLEGADAATIIVPLTSPARFFRVEGRSP